MELEICAYVQIENQLGFHKLPSYEMELGFSDLLTSYEMELETHVNVQIENQLGFHELPNWKQTRVLWTTSYEMQLETHVHAQIEKQLGFHEHQFACYH